MVVVRLPTSSAGSSREGGGDVLRALKHSLRSLAPDIDHGAIPFGIAPIDQALGGGLARAALHEIAASTESAITATTHFALGLASHGKEPRAVLWIAEEGRARRGQRLDDRSRGKAVEPRLRGDAALGGAVVA